MKSSKQTKIAWPILALLLILILSVASATLISCGSLSNSDDDDDSGGDDDDDSGGDDDDHQSSGVIYQIQQGEIPEGTEVTLTGVVATSQLNVDKSAFFVQETDGGQYSGIYIYVYSEVLEVVQDVEPGDILTITGEYTEFFDLSEVTVKSASNIEITGFTDPLTPEVVAPADIATGGPLTEAYESVLVAVVDVTVAEGVNSYGEWIVDAGLKIDDFFYLLEPVAGDTFESIAGPLLYGYDEFKIVPRNKDDFDGDVTGDDDDDDSSVDIYDIQQGNVTVDSNVTVSGVVVTSPMSTAPPGFFVQEPAGGQYSGIYVYINAPSADKAVTVIQGDIVTLTSCQYVEYYDLSELKCDENNINVTGQGTVPDPEVVSVDDIKTGGALAENYEGVLVKVESVTVSVAADENGEWELTGGLLVDDLFHEATPGVSDSFTSITGPLHYTWENFKIEPRSASDLVSSK